MYSRATAGVARSFLREVFGKLAPAGVQVDGGLEFRSVFEEECGALGLPLNVLPPRSPELDGIGRSLLKQGAPTAPSGSSAGAGTKASSPARP